MSQKYIRPAEVWQRIDPKLHNALNLYASLASAPAPSIDVARCTALVERIMADVEELHVLLRPDVGTPLSTTQRKRSIAHAIVALAHEPGFSGRLFRSTGLDSSTTDMTTSTTLPEALLPLLPDEEREHWQAAGPGGVANFLDVAWKEHADLREGLEEEHRVLAWKGPDRYVRIVRADWLTEPAAIAKFLASPNEPGTCRFCRIREHRSSMEMVNVDPALRHKRPGTKLSDAGRETIWSSGFVYAHPRCLPYLESWIEIAANFRPEPEPEAA